MNSLTITLPHTPRCLSPNAKAPGPLWQTRRRCLPSNVQGIWHGLSLSRNCRGGSLLLIFTRYAGSTKDRSRMMIMCCHGVSITRTGLVPRWGLMTGICAAGGLILFTIWRGQGRWKLFLRREKIMKRNNHVVVQQVCPMMRNKNGKYEVQAVIVRYKGITARYRLEYSTKRHARRAQHLFCTTKNASRFRCFDELRALLIGKEKKNEDVC